MIGVVKKLFVPVGKIKEKYGRNFAFVIKYCDISVAFP